MDYEKIRNDENRLQDFIRDKYDRKRWINSKKRDPMSLIISGETVDQGENSEE